MSWRFVDDYFFVLQEKRFAKMEKADILEMTIGHLIEMHQQNIGKCLYFLS